MAGLGVVICNHEGLVMASLSEVIQQPPTVIGMEHFVLGTVFAWHKLKKIVKIFNLKIKKKIILASFLAKLGQDKSKKKKKIIPSTISAWLRLEHSQKNSKQI